MQEDVRKIHGEVNQILNHTFGLTTAAITAFGVILAWSIPKAPGGDQWAAASIAVMSAMLMHVVLLLLHGASKLLTRQLFTLTSYLVIKHLSIWEKDWMQLEQRSAPNPPPTYSHFQALIFLTLWALATVWPVLVHYVYFPGKELPWRLAFPFLSAVGSALIGAIAERSLGNARSEAAARWKAVGIVKDVEEHAPGANPSSPSSLVAT